MSQHRQTEVLKALLQKVLTLAKLPEDVVRDIRTAIERPTLKVLAIEAGISERALESRIRRGWPLEKALTKPPRRAA